MSNYSKAPRGLFVQVELGRVFTAIAISPSKCLRQLLARDAIHAGRNSPDKGLRYRRLHIITMLAKNMDSICRHIAWTISSALNI